MDILREKEFRGGQRQKKYSNDFKDYLRSVHIQLVEAVGQFAEYWHFENIEFGTGTSFIYVCQKFVFDIFRIFTGTFSSLCFR